MLDATLVHKIETIPSGKTLALRTHETYASVRKTPAAYEVEAGWRVPEAHDDDYDSYSYHPLKGGVVAPWIGRRYTTESAEAAATLYLACKQALASRALPPGGTRIGSVQR